MSAPEHSDGPQGVPAQDGATDNTPQREGCLIPRPKPPSPARANASEVQQHDAPKGSGDYIAILNRKHFVVTVGGKTHIATERRDPITGYLDLQLGSMRDFSLLYKYWKVPVGDKSVAATDLWAASRERREYIGIDFMPGLDVPEYFNLWQGFAVEARQGDASLFWQHVETVICQGNQNHYLYLRKWMADMVQRPAELPGVAIVIRGKQGTGKTIFVDILGSLFGPHYQSLTRMEQLTGRFSGHLANKLLVCVSEAVWGGDKVGEGALKALITDPATPVEMKHKDLITVRNYKRFLVTTNEAWSVPMGMDDRRFLILEAGNQHKEDKAYFRALAEQMANGGREALLWDLQHEDLTDFEVRTKPRSTHGFDIKLRSADPIDRWWYERLYKGTTVSGLEYNEEDYDWNREPFKDSLHASFVIYCETHKLRPLTASAFGKELRKMLPGQVVGEMRPKNSGWAGAAIGRPRQYVLPPLDECRRAFEEYAKEGEQIWE